MFKMPRRNINNCREGLDLHIFYFVKWILFPYLAETTFIFKDVFYLPNNVGYASFCHVVHTVNSTKAIVLRSILKSPFGYSIKALYKVVRTVL
jgi:hypothetical protein